jgi:TonB family protein
MFGHGSFIASGLLIQPAALLAADRSTRPRRRSTSGSLALSGGVHLAALAVFLYITGGNGTPEPRLIEMRATIDRIMIPPPTIVPPSDGGGEAPPPKGGIVKPVPPRKGEEPSGDLPVNIPGVDPGTGVRAGNEPRRGDPGAAPAPHRPAPSPDIPSTYDVPPVPIVLPEPEYPSIAREAGIEGKVLVEAVVSAEGVVREVRGVSGNAILLDAAVNAVWTWRFRPARWQGAPVAARVSIPFHFTLR